jgi:hypothetical protein
MEELSWRLASQGQTVTNKRDGSCDRIAVIVEPRQHPMFETVVRTIMNYLGNGWNLHVFTAPDNIRWVTNRLPQWDITITPLSKDNLTTDEYSLLLMSEAFWNMIREQHVLLFQTDCVLFRHGMDAWIDGGYDYVGANYYNARHIAYNIGGIQGGLSLRRKDAMIDCIRRISMDDVHAYRRWRGMEPLGLDTSVIPEDIFFTHACEILQKRVPTIEKRREFSIEADYHPRALGHHGLRFPYLTREQQQELLTDA